MREPTVLVSSSFIPSPGDPEGNYLATVAMSYADSVRLAGGVPLVAPPLDDDAQVRQVLERCEAVLMVGGPDLLPASYGQEPHPEAKPMHPRRNASDLLLARATVDSGKPLLGICGGHQAVNVALGGSLHQHIPDMPELVGTDNHVSQIPNDNCHMIRIQPGSRLERILGATELEVNSAHHQAVDCLGEGLRAVAWSLTGVIEGIEGTDPDRFLILTQWHPERLAVDPPDGDWGPRPGPGRADQLAIFKALVAAVRE